MIQLFLVCVVSVVILAFLSDLIEINEHHHKLNETYVVMTKEAMLFWLPNSSLS